MTRVPGRRRTAVTARIEEVLSGSVRRRLLALPYVNDVGVGFKAVGGVLTNEPAIVAYVDRKLPRSSLPRADLVPGAIDGVPTDVEWDIDPRLARPNPALAADRQRVRPLSSGISIGISDAHAGTLGLFARRPDGKAVLVSNYHVLYRGRDVLDITGEPHHVFQPPIGSNNKIGEVVDGSVGGQIDAAIATLNEEGSSCCCKSVIPHGNKIGETTLPGVALGQMGDVVHKTGRSTGHTVGKIVNASKAITGAVDYSEFDLPAGSSFTFNNLIMIVRWDEATATFQETQPFADDGDSGSALVNSANEIVGLHFMSYHDPARNRHYSFACHIETIESTLGVTVPGTRTGLAAAPAGPPDTMIWSLDATIDTSSGTVIIAGVDFSAESVRGATERLETRLRSTAAGRAWMCLFETHWHEVLGLVNRRRPVTVAWHRSQGPTWLAAVVRSATRPSYSVPDDIGSASRRQLTELMGDALMEEGGSALRRDLEANAAALQRILLEVDSAPQLVERLRSEPPAAEPVGAGD